MSPASSASPENCPRTRKREGTAKSFLSRPTRRAILLGASFLATEYLTHPRKCDARHPRAAVFVARGQRYDGPLMRTIEDGLVSSGLSRSAMLGKRVLLKPNLVEPTRVAPHITTHPAVVGATAEVFRSWGAHVTVGEAPGHVRDTEMALCESGLQEMLDLLELPFADLNYEEVGWVKNAGGTSKLSGFHFPRTVIEADVIVSMAKMKTHHWMGVTASLKNMYGVIPGIKYGWPKNVLHHAGLPQSVFDINASLPKTIAIIDGIECMEGDGPVMGTPKHMGLLVMGLNPAAVDSTVCRLMKIAPQAVPYLALAAGKLGPVDERLILQRGEAWQPLSQAFHILDRPHLTCMRAV